MHTEAKNTKLTTSKKRRIRRKKLHASIYSKSIVYKENNIDVSTTNYSIILDSKYLENSVQDFEYNQKISEPHNNIFASDIQLPNFSLSKNCRTQKIKMSSKENSEMSREDVKAAREAKKLAKLKAKKKIEEKSPITVNIASKDSVPKTTDKINSENIEIKPTESQGNNNNTDKKDTVTKTDKNKSSKSKDEVDKAIVNVNSDESVKASKEAVKAERAAKKACKQAKKKGEETTKPGSEMSVTDMVNTLKDIVVIAKEMQAVTARVEAIDLGSQKVMLTSNVDAKVSLFVLLLWFNFDINALYLHVLYINLIINLLILILKLY